MYERLNTSIETDHLRKIFCVPSLSQSTHTTDIGYSVTLILFPLALAFHTKVTIQYGCVSLCLASLFNMS